MGAGASAPNHCMHGTDAVIDQVIDWRPLDYFTVSIQLPIPGAPRIVMTRALEDRPNGVTHLEMRVAQPKPKDKDFVDQAGAKFAKNLTKAIESLRLILQEQQSSVAAVDEPPLRLSDKRFLTAPVRSGATR